MAEVKTTFSANDQTGPTVDKVVGNYERIRAAASSAMDKISDAASYMGDKISKVYDAAHSHFSALPEVMTAGMIGAIGNVVVQMGILPGVIGSTAAKIFSGGGAISAGMETASTSMIAGLGIKISSAIEKTIGTISAAAGGAILSMLSMVAVLAIVALFTAAIKATLDWTESVSALSKQLQMSSESASAYKIALDEQKVSTAEFSSANATLINTLNDNESVITGLGIATRNASGELRSTADLLPEVNTKLLGMTDKTAQNSKALEIYGSKWNDLTGVMKINSATMADATKQAQGLGLVVGKDNVNAAAKYQTALATLETVTKSLMISTGQDLLPVFADLYKIMADAATIIVPILGMGLKVLGAIAKEIGLDFGLLLISIDTAGRAIYNLATGDLNAAKQNLLNYKEALIDFYQQSKALATGQPDPTKPVTQNSIPDSQKTAIARTMQLELQALRQQNSDKAALYKADSAIQQTIIKGTYDAGLMTTAAYYDAVSKQSEKSASDEIKSAQEYLTAVKTTVQSVRDLKGTASDEYKSALNAEAQAQQAVNLAQLNYGKTLVENSIKTAAAMRENLGKVIDAISSYSSSYAELGKSKLSLADEQFNTRLQHQVDILKEYGKTWSNIRQPVNDYLAVINEVEAKQMAFLAENKNAIESIAKANENPNAFGKASTKALLQLKLDELNIEKNAATQRLSVWDNYFKALKTLITDKQSEINAANQALMDNRQKTIDAMKAVTSAPIDDSYKDAVTKYQEQLAQWKTDIQTALSSGDHDSAMKTIQNVQDAAVKMQDFKGVFVDMTRTVREFNGTGFFDQKTIDRTETYKQEIIDAGSKTRDLTEIVKLAGDGMETLGQKKIADLDDDMDRLKLAGKDAEAAIKSLRETIGTLDDKIMSINRQITLNLEDNVTAGLAGVRNALAALTNRDYVINLQYSDNYPSVTSSWKSGGSTDTSGAQPGGSASDYYQVGDSFYWGDGTYGGPAFERGTDSVASTGLALVHQYEKITPAGQNNPADGGQASGSVILQGDMHFNLPNVTNQTTAKELARQVWPEIQQLQQRYRKTANG